MASTVRAMEFQDVVQRRRMVRDFSDEPVARPILDQLMANATRTPSAGYSQGFAFVVLTDPESAPAVLGDDQRSGLERRIGVRATDASSGGDHPARPQAGLSRPLRAA